jgi:ABC-2 type transport system permease protein
MIRRIYAIAAKELRHILRDWQTLLVILIMPVIMMFLYGYALTLDLTRVPVLIEDPVPSTESVQVAHAVDASTMFRVIGTVPVAAYPEELFRKLHMKAIVRFSPHFAADLRRGSGGASVQVLIDGSDPNVGTILKNAFGPVIQKATLDALGITVPSLVTVDEVVLYNEEQKSALFFVPGLMAIILLMISALLTSVTITREKELGTMEQLLVSPVRPAEIIAGKILPYLGLAATDGALILLVGYYLFGVHVAGSLAFLTGASLVYIFTSLAIGLLVSTVARNQQQAMMIVLPATMLPTIILSGFIFPLASLAWPLRCIAAAVPATYYLEVIRGIVLKGMGVTVLWRPLCILGAIGLLLFIVSVRQFKERL